MNCISLKWFETINEEVKYRLPNVMSFLNDVRILSPDLIKTDTVSYML